MRDFILLGLHIFSRLARGKICFYFSDYDSLNTPIDLIGMTQPNNNINPKKRSLFGETNIHLINKKSPASRRSQFYHHTYRSPLPEIYAFTDYLKCSFVIIYCYALKIKWRANISVIELMYMTYKCDWYATEL